MFEWTVKDLKAILEWVRSLDQDPLLVDAAFPHLRLMYVEPGHPRLALGDDTSAAGVFFASFRENMRDLAFPDLRTLSRAAHASGRHAWVHVTGERFRALHEDLQDNGIAAICALETDEIAHWLHETYRSPDMFVLQFTDLLGNGMRYAAIIPHRWNTGLVAPESSRVAQVALDPRETAESISTKIAELCSDCPWQAEGDRDFSWMWTGPTVTHRICLGDPPSDITGLAVHFMDHPSHENIADNVILQVNGRTVPCDMDAMGDTGGAATIRLPSDVVRPTVLGVCAFPEARPIEGEPRMLRACLTAIEAVV